MFLSLVGTREGCGYACNLPSRAADFAFAKEAKVGGASDFADAPGRLSRCRWKSSLTRLLPAVTIAGVNAPFPAPRVSTAHRRKLTCDNVLPLHAELVPVLKVWLKQMEPDEPLFPKLARRRTWLMVKKDLERTGIAYVTKEGIADFHAAGRHSHITQLLRSSASLPAKELARHTDVRLTMKYTHIGIEDQARALAALPAPLKSWLHIGCSSRVLGCLEASQSDTTGGAEILP